MAGRFHVPRSVTAPLNHILMLSVGKSYLIQGHGPAVHYHGELVSLVVSEHFLLTDLRHLRRNVEKTCRPAAALYASVYLLFFFFFTPLFNLTFGGLADTYRRFSELPGAGACCHL